MAGNVLESSDCGLRGRQWSMQMDELARPSHEPVRRSFDGCFSSSQLVGSRVLQFMTSQA